PQRGSGGRRGSGPDGRNSQPLGAIHARRNRGRRTHAGQAQRRWSAPAARANGSEASAGQQAALRIDALTQPGTALGDGAPPAPCAARFGEGLSSQTIRHPYETVSEVAGRRRGPARHASAAVDEIAADVARRLNRPARGAYERRAELAADVLGGV